MLPNIEQMGRWNYDRPDCLELRYEDVIRDERGTFIALFRHYGFTEEAVANAVRIAGRYHYARVAGRPLGQVKDRQHLRSGRPGQWRETLSAKHGAYFVEVTGDAAVKLGYPPDPRL